MAENSNNNITKKIGVVQHGRIKVHTQILNDLSSGIYSSAASCIKELVNNSYDAEAREVTIRLLPLKDNITIIDDGNGMDALEFDKNFAWISKSNKRKTGELSPNLKRPLIGKIGIGFIAVNEICTMLEISSSKKGESIKFTATINFKKYFEEAAFDELDQNLEDNKKGIIKAEYDLINEPEDPDEHYTVINLTGLKEGVKQIFEGKQYFSQLVSDKKKKKGYDKNFFPNMKAILDHHFTQKLKSFDEDNEYVKFIIDLASYIPIEYLPGGPIQGVHDKFIDGIVQFHRKLDFKVDLDGIYLNKPIYFPDDGTELNATKSLEDVIVLNKTEKIKFKGYFYIHHGIIFPVELNGIAVRLKGIPIAPHYGFDRTFLNYPNYLNQIFRNWVSGEIYVEEGLEDAMNIDRASFRLTHPHFLAFQNYLHKFLNEEIFPIALEIYESAKDERDKEKRKENRIEKQSILKSKKVNVKIVENKSSKSGKTVSPVTIKKDRLNKVSVEVEKEFAESFTKKEWVLLEDIFLIFEMAYKESKGDTGKLREIFYKKINDWRANK